MSFFLHAVHGDHFVSVLVDATCASESAHQKSCDRFISQSCSPVQPEHV